MDLDAYVEAHAAEWARLGELVKTRRRTGDQIDEMIALYQRAATHLSVVRSSAPDPVVVGRLSTLVGQARAAVTGSTDPAWRDVTRFVTVALPAALYRARAWWLGTMLASVLAATAVGVYIGSHPALQLRLVSQAEMDSYINTDFEQYYKTYAHGSFAAQVWTHNALLAALSIAFGILGLPVLYLLWTNASSVGVIGGIMVSHGRAGLFFSLILPHGVLELTAFFVAGGVGLRLFWAWVAPGARTRAQALAEEGRAAGAISLGVGGMLAVSGFIEGFITPSHLPTGVKIAIGVCAETAFLLYVFVLGRRAARSGEIGDVATQDAGDTLPVRA